MSGPSSYSSSHGSTSPTKLTLVLPPLHKAISLNKPAKFNVKSGKKVKGKGKEKITGPPRPPKLKPLKEVIARLISLAQKRDSYGFFLRPVDTAQVPGYTDIIKRPMDFGTIYNKVSKGKYRTLEEFSDDMRLVTTNAKQFNPPGSIYYTEADRIETWVADQITKVASTVIEYETDWKLDVDGEEEEEADYEDDQDMSVPPPDMGASPGPSAVDEELRSLHAIMAGGRRPPQRAAVKKIELERAKELEKEKEKVIDRPIENTLDEDGHMPGYRVGVGVFPPESGWSEVMLALKFRDKRYKTKKERLRIEKEGLPRAPDGSLDYWEVEDPWHVLHTLAPDPDVPPTINPIFPPLTNVDPSQTPLHPPAHILAPSLSSPHQAAEPTTKAVKRKYWSINRTGYGRGTKGKDREDTHEPTPTPHDSNSRPIQPTDYGGYSTLIPRLAAEAKVTTSHAAGALGTEERLSAFLRAGIEADTPSSVGNAPAPKGARGYWTDARARDASEYVRDMVYGGPDGLAYIRSIAEFVSGPGAAQCKDVPQLPLGMTLPEWVLRTTISPLTQGRLSLLASISKRLARPSDPESVVPHQLQSQIDTSATMFPHLTLLLLAMRQILTQPIDLAHLLKSPEELLGVHTSSGMTSEKRKREDDDSSSGEVKKQKQEDDLEDDMQHGPTQMNGDGNLKLKDEQASKPSIQRVPDFSNVGEFALALHSSGDAILVLEKKRAEMEMKPQGRAVDEVMLEELRLGLLRLARAVPVDQLARLPPELVPAEIRHIVPTKVQA